MFGNASLNRFDDWLIGSFRHRVIDGSPAGGHLNETMARVIQWIYSCRHTITVAILLGDAVLAVALKFSLRIVWSSTFSLSKPKFQSNRRQTKA